MKTIDPALLLELVRSGYTNAQIAEHLGCAVRTIDRRRRKDPSLSKAIIDARADLIERAAEHGTLRRYRRGCHCRACTSANTTRCYETRMKWRERNGLGPPDPRIGRKREIGSIDIDIGVKASQPVDRETLIAQAIARGESTSTIMRRLSCDYADVQAMREQILEAS